MSDVSEGYRMSEVGVIPEDWEVKTFGEVMTGFSSGATPYRGRPEYYKGNIRWITSGELNYNVITDTIEKITENAVRNANLKIHPKGTFLMAITGLEAEGTRGSCGIVGAEATTNQSCMALFPTKELLTEYLFHYYVNYGNSLALEYCQGTKQQSYTAKIVKILPIIVPPTIEEQQAIASALSDVDALITALDQLITKKRNIKQGAMQQLITDKKRLPGFEVEWKMKMLGEVVEIKKGQLITDSTRIDGIIPVIAGGKTPAYYHNKANRDGKTITVSGSGASAGYVAFHIIPIFASDCSTIEESKSYSIEFIYFLLQSLQERVYKMQTGGAQPHIHPNDLNPIIVSVPIPEEQQAIAQILTDMDTEIESLKQKQSKYKAIKQGMMQELLTGKTRLL